MIVSRVFYFKEGECPLWVDSSDFVRLLSVIRVSKLVNSVVTPCHNKKADVKSAFLLLE